MSNKKGRLSASIWITIVLFMFMSTTAVSIESMYMGLFLDNTVFKNGSMGAKITLTDSVNLITSLSVVITVVTSFVMGTLSEKLKNRKVFISIGLIIWGIVMFCFSNVNVNNVAKNHGIYVVDEVITITAIYVICFTLIFSFLRSTVFDTAFNSWIVDVSTPETSTIIEIIFTAMGFVSTAVISFLVSSAQARAIRYNEIAILLGVVAIALGILGFFLIKNPQKDDDTKEVKEVSNAKNSNYWADVFYGFKRSTMKENSNLYAILSSGCLFNCACQVFIPYLFIYISSVIFPANENIDNLMGAVGDIAILAVLAIFLCVLALMKAYSIKKSLSFIPSVVCLIVGLLILSSTKHILGIIVGLVPGLIGYIIIMIQFGATVRDNIPKDKVGLFQGVRMFFLVLIPGIVGPTLGNIAAKNSDVTYISNGAEKLLPTESMFLYAATIAVFIFIPMLIFLKKDKEKALREKTE